MQTGRSRGPQGRWLERVPFYRLIGSGPPVGRPLVRRPHPQAQLDMINYCWHSELGQAEEFWVPGR
eukprot:5371745-Pyramimonas_sp.AAC.1